MRHPKVDLGLDIVRLQLQGPAIVHHGVVDLLLRLQRDAQAGLGRGELRIARERLLIVPCRSGPVATRFHLRSQVGQAGFS